MNLNNLTEERKKHPPPQELASEVEGEQEHKSEPVHGSSYVNW